MLHSWKFLLTLIALTDSLCSSLSVLLSLSFSSFISDCRRSVSLCDGLGNCTNVMPGWRREWCASK